jgi:sec-independent protein translocase protein TatA
MNTLIAGIFGGWEIVLILAVILILFGAKKLPELAKGLGQGIKEFKKATTEVQHEIHRAVDDDSYTAQKRIEPPSGAKPAETASSVEHKA